MRMMVGDAYYFLNTRETGFTCREEGNSNCVEIIDGTILGTRIRCRASGTAVLCLHEGEEEVHRVTLEIEENTRGY